MNHIHDAMNQAADLIAAAARSAMAEGLIPECDDLPQNHVEVPKDLQNGDYASTFCLQCAKKLRMAPRKLAELLVERVKLEGTYFTEVTIAGPGFLNFRLSQDWFSAVLWGIRETGENYGRTKAKKPEKVMVEFVSANPTGPMHLGNARGGVLGDSLAEVFARAGHDAHREFYVNDAGNQIEKFAKSIDARYLQLVLGEDAVEFPEDGYHGADIRDLAEKYRAQFGDGLAQQEEGKRHEVLAAFGLQHNIPRMQADLERYKIHYDLWFRESSLYESNYVSDTVDKLTANGWTYEKDGALWLRTADLLRNYYRAEGKKDEDIEKLALKDDVLRRANGFYTYFAADIAYHRNKFEVRGFDRVINIWGADHHGHVARLKCALDALGLDGSHRLEIVLMQLVQLLREGQPVRMSKRTGNAIALSDLLDEVPIDAARFFFNSRSAGSPIDFDLDLAVRQDSDNPVYYVQYAHARIQSILRALAQDGIDTDPQADLSVLTAGAELDLIRELSKLPEEIRLAAFNRDPSRLCRYAGQIATAFHRFYTECRIKGAEDAVRDARIYLCRCTAQVIKNTLNCIGVTAPDRM